jgi:hypothetical protein
MTEDTNTNDEEASTTMPCSNSGPTACVSSPGPATPVHPTTGRSGTTRVHNNGEWNCRKRIGAKFVLPLLALSLVIWFLVMRLASDQYQGVRRR